MFDNREKYSKDNKKDSNLYMRNLVKNILKEDGIGGFYLGFRVELLRVLPSNAIIFIVYEYVRNLMEGRSDRKATF